MQACPQVDRIAVATQVLLDLRSRGGRKALRALARWADVVVRGESTGRWSLFLAAWAAVPQHHQAWKSARYGSAFEVAPQGQSW